MDESDAADLAIEKLAGQLDRAIRLGSYGERLLEEIQRMLLSNDQRDIDSIEDMSLADIIAATADKVANLPSSSGRVGELMMEIMENDQCKRADRAFTNYKDRDL